MKKNLTKNIIAVIATLVLAIIIAPMFKAETAKAETAKVKYAFTKVRDKEKIVEGQVYCYITEYAVNQGNSVDESACLLGIPAGAGVLQAELNGKNSYYPFTDAKNYSNRTDYMYPFRVVEVDANHLFDTCGGCVYSLRRRI